MSSSTGHQHLRFGRRPAVTIAAVGDFDCGSSSVCAGHRPELPARTATWRTRTAAAEPAAEPKSVQRSDAAAAADDAGHAGWPDDGAADGRVVATWPTHMPLFLRLLLLY